MSFFDVMASGYEGITVEYRSARESEGGYRVSASVHLTLDGANAYLCLSVADARSLLEQLPVALALHEAAEATAAATGRAA